MSRQRWMGLGRALETSSATVQYISLAGLAKKHPAVERMPLTLKVLLESVIRQLDGSIITEEHVQNLLDWRGQAEAEMPFKPVMQDFTGVPAVVDLAVMRDVFASLGGDPKKINPLIPVDLVIDHSVQVDLFGSLEAFAYNAKREFERNRERYEFLRWASEVFDNFTVVPPATGIVHQVNLEYLAKVVQTQQQGNETVAYPDTLLGTDSHTTMINGIGVLGWGVGGIEAEAAILGQPLFMRLPEVIGFRMTGHLREGVTATDLMLTVTERLREYGVVGRFVEFFGPGLEGLSLADRATISNMCPEFGANSALFPVDESSIRYMRVTGRPDSLIDLVERYTKEQGLCRSSVEPEYTNFLEFDLAAVSTSIAGPKRPQDRIELHDSKGRFRDFLQAIRAGDRRENSVQLGGGKAELSDGAVVIWAITSCTNTSNPHVMVGAGLLAKKAVEKGLKVPPYVKMSLAPGSRVVTCYLELSGLTPYLEELGYHFVGYGCTTCIGNSGPLDERISRAILDNDVVACAVLSRNRNFEGRIHPEVRANYLASPLLVIAYGLAGTVEIDLDNDPLGQGKDGPVYLWDIWPSQSEVEQIVGELVTPNLSAEEYGNVYTGNEIWNSIQLSGGDLYDWQESSTYIRKPPFFDGLTKQLPSARPIQGTRVLAVLGDSVTTDHISPAGMIPYDSRATEWLRARGVEFRDFNTFGSRRGNHEVMMRGTFGNIRIRNRLAPGTEGGYTRHLPDGETMSIYDAAMNYAAEGTPFVVLAGKDYGMGSSRDWAAKGANLLGIRAVIAESYEPIHRSNLIGMGVLPLQFDEGQSAESLGLTGEELLDIEPSSRPGQEVTVTVQGGGPSGESKTFQAISRIDTSVEMECCHNEGILHALLRSMPP